VQNFFLETLVVPAARRRGLEDEYAYLRPSIKAFPQGRQQERLARAAGFAAARHEEVEFGLMGCLVVQKAGVGTGFQRTL
jgi:demethylphylloquinol methyltransferase